MESKPSKKVVSPYKKYMMAGHDVAQRLTPGS